MSAALRTAREAIVRAHMNAENRHDVTATVATFSRARYEVVPTGDIYDDRTSVASFLAETQTAFPDFQLSLDRLHHADDAEIVEVTFRGTHRGMWRGLPATGRAVRYVMCNVFVFEGEGLVCERLYFDVQGILQQVGIARDPTTLSGRVATVLNHPVTIARAIVRAVVGRSG